jgi:hypothetical protein
VHSASYFKNKLFSLAAAQFETHALELFRFQARHNAVYRRFLNYLGKNPKHINSIKDIPYLPIQFFKSENVSIYQRPAPVVFTSSGTTGSQTSRHAVYNLEYYHQVCRHAFELKYGPVQDYFIAGLLPSYLERSGSSLISMVQHFCSLSADDESGFYLNNLSALSQILQAKRKEGKKILLIGVTFALLDLAEQYPQNLSGITLMETGGMKGRRQEMIRSAVHQKLKTAFRLPEIHSEYGMTELLSQAYSQGQGKFTAPPWLRTTVREVDDPFSAVQPGKTGGLNICDLANVDSCAFIATDDLARMHRNGYFEIMGRLDAADVRGCNLMVV